MNILVVSADAELEESIVKALGSSVSEVARMGDWDAAEAALLDGEFEVLALDTSAPSLTLKRALTRFPELDLSVQTLLIAGREEIDMALETAGDWVSYYLSRPFSPGQMKHAISGMQRRSQADRERLMMAHKIDSVDPKNDFESNDPGMKEVVRVARKVADAECPVLMTGESGTGKTVLAREIHRHSPRRSEPFVTISCPTLNRDLLASELFGHAKGAFTGAHRSSPGRIAQAQGGALFLDEIGDLPLELQPQLLRALQDGEYERLGEGKTRKADFRLIAATNRDLESMVRDGAFREDLFFRINVVVLRIPPLRERRTDVGRLARNYLEFFVQRDGKAIRGFSDEAEAALEAYEWPGNLRELRNLVERAVILCEGDRVELSDCGFLNGVAANGALRVGDFVTLDCITDAHIEEVVNRAGGVEAGAEILGVNATTIYRRRRRASAKNGNAPSVVGS